MHWGRELIKNGNKLSQTFALVLDQKVLQL
jgi:hypothetical protein